MNERLERYVSKTNDSKEKQALNPEQEKQLKKEKEQILMLSKAQRESLKNDVILSYLKDFHNVDISIYPKEIGEKFIQEIKMLFDEFKNFDESMITKLKEIRENMSFGLESGKSNEYYRNMILGNKIEERIKVLKLFTENINGEKLKIGNTEFNKLDYESFKNNTINLDKNNSVDIFNKINLKDYKFSLKQTFAEEFKKVIDKSNTKYDLIMADLTRLPQVVGVKGFENLKELKLNNGQTVNLEDLYKNYNNSYVEFKNKNKIFEFGNKQMESSDKGFGLDDKKYGIGYDQIKDVYKDKMQDINVENMGLTDLVIMMRVLFGIVPVAGDVVSSIDDTIQANAGVNFDGSMMGMGEKVFGYFTGVLGLTIVGGSFAKLAKGPKLAKAMSTLGKIIDKISKTPEILKSIGENQKVMNMIDNMKSFIPGIDKIIDKVKSIKNPEGKVKSEVKPQTVEKITNNEPDKNIAKIKQTETPDNLYKSHFSTEIPESLKHENPMAWIDKSGEIHYNKIFLEEKFGIKITTKDGKTLFDGKNLKDHKKAPEIIDFLKELKSHEVTHRILETKGITELKAGEKIYSQEDICSIVDGSKKLEKVELEALEIALKEKFGSNFKLIKDGKVDPDAMRRFDTKMVASGVDVKREKEAAKGQTFSLEKITIDSYIQNFDKLAKNVETFFDYNNPIILKLGQNSEDNIFILKTSQIPNGILKTVNGTEVPINTKVPYIIFHPKTFTETNGAFGLKGLREGENISIGRLKKGETLSDEKRFSFSDLVSREHLEISLKDNKIGLKSNGANGTEVGISKLDESNSVSFKHKGIDISGNVETVDTGNGLSHQVKIKNPDGEYIYIMKKDEKGNFVYSGELLIKNGDKLSVLHDEEYLRKINLENNKFQIDNFYPELKKLWPDISKGLEQGPIGNCYFISALTSIKEHPKGPELLSQIIKVNPDGKSYTVNFNGIGKNTIITEKDLLELGDIKAKGQLGDAILELAYLKLRYSRENNIKNYEEIGGSVQELLKRNNQGKRADEGGFMYDVFNDFFLRENNTLNNFKINGSNLLEALKQKKPSDIITFGTTNGSGFVNGILNTIKTNYPPEKHKEVFEQYFSYFFPNSSDLYKQISIEKNSNDPIEVYTSLINKVNTTDLGDRISINISDINGQTVQLPLSHAYSLGNYSLDETGKGWVEIINPHDTEKKAYKIGLQEFMTCFTGFLSKF